MNQEIERVLQSNYLNPIRRLMGKENFPYVKVSGKNSPEAEFFTLIPDLQCLRHMENRFKVSSNSLSNS